MQSSKEAIWIQYPLKLQLWNVQYLHHLPVSL
eukprot:Gb_38409 [translate_table: standard]